jgi:hypothetical protein
MVSLAGLAQLALAAGCAGPPWLMGRPLNRRPSIPATSAYLTFEQRHVQVEEARAQGLTVIELEALLALDDAQRLTDDERSRLVVLLLQRAREFWAMGRGIPRSRDLETAVRLEPARIPALNPARARAARDAGDAWLAIGDKARASAAYQLAQQLGAYELSFRLLALNGGEPPVSVPLVSLRYAISALPPRALLPFARAYLRREDCDRPTLVRLLSAARQASVHEADEGTLAVQLQQALDRCPPGAVDPAALASAAVTPPVMMPVPGDVDRWVQSGPLLSRRLLPLVVAAPELLATGPQARRWADKLLEEDPTSPDTQELAALIDGLARRFGGTERKLIDLVYYSPDRFDGLVRGAAVWERVGRPREACVMHVRAARWRDDPEDPIWRQAIACTRHDPGAGDWYAIRQYVLERAPADRRAAVAAALDAPATAAPAARSMP